jgi:3-carboxy-cis,cis-muconate cycloisomerase
MPTHIADSVFLRDLYGTDAMRAIFSDASLLQRWLDVEVALAQAQAELGVIPDAAAQEISRKADAEALDWAIIKRGIDHTLHPIVPVIRELQRLCADDAGEWIHYGATTQDIMDTAVVLQLKQAIALIEAQLNGLIEALAILAERHRDTLMTGRTHGQHALPLTFGFKVAVWLEEFNRHRARLAECKPRVLVGQFGGAVGTLASITTLHPLETRQRMMALLGLGTPAITWHVAHDGFAECANVLALIAGSCGKIANEVILLQKSEVWELEEPYVEGKIGSSTMPHKRNPMVCEAIVALSRLVFNSARNGWDGLIQSHERDWSVNHMEWAYVPEVCVLTDGALAQTRHVLQALRVHPERMAANTQALGGLMLSEAVMFALGKHVGKQTAHELVHACAMRAIDTGRNFRDELLANTMIAQYLSASEIDVLLDPSRYTGLAGQMTDMVLGKHTDATTQAG